MEIHVQHTISLHTSRKGRKATQTNNIHKTMNIRNQINKVLENIRMPRLENWDTGLKSLLRLYSQLSPHIQQVYTWHIHNKLTFLQSVSLLINEPEN